MKSNFFFYCIFILTAGIILTQLISCKKSKPANPEPEPLQDTITHKSLKIDILAQNLQIPWGAVEMIDGKLLFCERNGRISLLNPADLALKTIYVRYVWATGEGGLLGLAIDPDFQNNHYIYVYETLDSNRVVRLIFNNESLTEDKVIVKGIPSSPNHDGGALKFGPDGYLYIGTGDALKPASAQDRNALSGKILRVDRNGNPAPGNPFYTRIWSYGHRNVQGFTWTSSGTMLATEHGPSGEFGWVAHDEINQILPGKNYGWPLALAGTEKDSLTPPLTQSGDETWAPSGCIFTGKNSIWPNCLLVACLRGQKIIRFTLNAAENGVVSRADTLSGEFHRLRTVLALHDGSIVFTSSNLGNINPPPQGDDRIYRLFRP